jgi:hypothetical protein
VQQALEAWEHINKYSFVLADYEVPMEQAIAALKAALEQPQPPPEAQTEAEKIAYCAGWWTAMEQKREQPEQEPVAWSDARLRGIASDYFPDAKDWPAAMLCLRHLLMEQAKYQLALSRVPLAQQQEQEQEQEADYPEEKLQAVAEYISDKYHVWYGVAARDIEEVLRQSVRCGLVSNPPRREWQSLTGEEIQSIHDTYHKRMGPQEFARSVEQACKERNT